MSLAFFVTGTGTEVGKTVLTRALSRAASQRGLKVAALKPVESGAEVVDGVVRGADAHAIARASRMRTGDEPNIAYCLLDPVSPHLAARRENVIIDPTAIHALLARHREVCDVLFVEGAGGLLVPLRDDLLQADVYATASLEAIVVARDELGAINATLLTLEALRARAFQVRGVILNRARDVDWGNREAIERHGKVPVLGTMPDSPGADDDALAQLAETHLRLRELWDAI